MKGSKYLVIKNNRVCYDLKFERNITIIKGNSGTGKTTLINMVQDYIDMGKGSGIKVKTDINNLRVLKKSSIWNVELETYKNSIYFADEEVEYVLTKQFYDLLCNTGSYLVYITRSYETKYLNYSISSLCYLESTKKDSYYLNTLHQVYTDSTVKFIPDLVLTEDSTSGKDMLDHSLSVDVESSYGNSNMLNRLRFFKNKYNNIYIIVDGAAFGPYIAELLTEIKITLNCNIVLFAPESFEYLILNTSKFRRYCEDELKNTSNYVDPKDFKTWENYYENLLKDLCNKYYNHVVYSKVKWDSLNTFFKKKNLLTEILDLDSSVKEVNL